MFVSRSEMIIKKKQNWIKIIIKIVWNKILVLGHPIFD